MKRTLTAAILLLSACSSPQSIQYLTLPDSAYILPERQGRELALKVVLAEPLQHGGPVYRTDAYSLHPARRHLWAVPLEQAAEARLANELNRLDRTYRFTPVKRSNSAQTLTVYLEAFNGSYLGHTLVQGYSRWPDGTGRNFRIETPQQGDGYPAMLQSLSQGLGRAAEHIAR
ncbi:MAG: ABC-type transport auxiliary lipoprotein family protein [Neisseria sp.]|nr:ABC-type transport auxiliary lipoprotein family protein [Neisseria sp.]